VKTNSDFEDLLAALNAAGAEYLVVGAHALAAHGHPRASKDLDVWVHATADNAERTYGALAAFGAPLDDLRVDDLSTADTVFQVGVEPVRIDIVTSIDGVEFEEAWPDRHPEQEGGWSTAGSRRRRCSREVGRDLRNAPSGIRRSPGEKPGVDSLTLVQNWTSVLEQ
jgi:hypothetical protein